MRLNRLWLSLVFTLSPRARSRSSWDGTGGFLVCPGTRHLSWQAGGQGTGSVPAGQVTAVSHPLPGWPRGATALRAALRASPGQTCPRRLRKWPKRVWCTKGRPPCLLPVAQAGCGARGAPAPPPCPRSQPSGQRLQGQISWHGQERQGQGESACPHDTDPAPGLPEVARGGWVLAPN